MRFPSWWVVGFVALAVPACAAEETAEEPAEADVAAIVRKDISVVDGQPGVDFELTGSAISAPRTSLAALGSHVAGDVLVSRAGSGFLRRVREVRTDGDRVVLDTEPAALDDVFEQARVRGSIGDGCVTGAATPAPGAVGPRAVKLELPPLSLRDKRIPIGGGSEIEIVEAQFDLKSELDFDLLMRRRKIEKMKVLAAGDAHARAHFRYHIKKPAIEGGGAMVRLKGGEEGTTIAETPPYHAVFWAGYVPVVVSVRGRLVAEFKILAGGAVEGEQDVSADGAVSLGLVYENGGWRNQASRSLKVDGHGNHALTSHTISGEVRLTARLDVSFYEVAGPFVGLQGYAGILEENTGSGSQWFAIEGVRGIAGAQVAIFGKSIVGYSTVLFDESTRSRL